MNPQSWHASSSSTLRRVKGFTLIEMVMVIVIMGIIASMVAVFVVKPVQGYLDSVRRAELTDGADVALRRIMRDVRLALPNSIRVTTTGGMSYIEFIMTSAGGRYRGDADGGNALSFTNTATLNFDVLGTMPSNPAMLAQDYVVVYNLGEGYQPANAYNYNDSTDACRAGGCNVAKIAAGGVAGNTITLTANPFAAQTPPLPSPSNRFQVIPGGTKAVTYACPTSGAGNVSRYWNYGLSTTQPTTFASGSSAVLASGTASCVVEYTPAALSRKGLLYVSLTLTASGESVTLFQEIHVDNSP